MILANNQNKLSRAVRTALFSTAALSLTLASTARAEDDADKKADDKDVEQIVVVGSRAAPRSVGESPVPVDLISAEEMSKQGTGDMTSMLSSVVPSFNANSQPINDASTLVRPANLRGLSSDQTLVLVNGKRRHRSAVITFLGGQLSDGAQGPDISVIPSIALKQVEVLRDGAAAQYGSDAIAGVMNFVLKDDSEGGAIEYKWGQYYEGDGTLNTIAANVGLPLTDNGFVNLSFESNTVDPTSRSVQRDDAQTAIDGGNTNIANPAQVWGSPEVKEDIKFFMNAGLDLGKNREAYMFANLAKREVEGGFYFRHPYTRGGVYSNDGGSTLLIGNTDESLGQCGDIALKDADGKFLPYSTISADVAALPDHCFTFLKMLPGGFTPRFGGEITDASITMGTKGEFTGDFLYDFSASLGQNQVDFSIFNTLNPSMGATSPRDFRPGSYVQTEKGLNADFVYSMTPEGWNEALDISFGTEYRADTFEIKAGDPASYQIGSLYEQGFGIGSNGFPGFKPEDAGVFSRHNYSAYVDMEHYVTEQFLLGGAIRYENFSDFGSTTNYKLTARYEFNDNFAMRGGVSTGFRAPTIGQNSVRNVSTAFSNGQLSDRATLPPTHPISVKKGAKPLGPEESTNFSLGFVFNMDDLNITMDYFKIDVEGRLSQVSPQVLTAQDKTELVAAGYLEANSLTSVTYFTNDFDTETQGIDLIASYPFELIAGGMSRVQLALNWTDTEVTKYSDNISKYKIEMLEDNLPALRYTLTLMHTQGDLHFTARANYYSDYYEDHLDDNSEDARLYPGNEVTVDVEASYDINDNFNIAFGASNLFDNYPDKNPLDSAYAGAAYPTTSPMGFNGGFYYTRLAYKF